MNLQEEQLFKIEGIDTDGVSAAFELILEQLVIVEKELKQEGEQAFRKSDFAKAVKLGEAGTSLTSFKQQLESLSHQWDTGVEEETRRRVSRRIRSQSKGPKTGLKVILSDGTIVQKPIAADTFVEVIRRMGVDNVYQLGLKLNNIPLVSEAKVPDNNQKSLGRYYICTHCNTKTKKRYLEKIAASLNHNILVEIQE